MCLLCRNLHQFVWIYKALHSSPIVDCYCMGGSVQSNIGALIIRIGFGDPLYYKYNKEPPKP